MGKLFVLAPLLVLPVLIYHAIAFAPGEVRDVLAGDLFRVTMVSGGVWSYTVGDALVSFALLMLLFEIVKSTSTQSLSLINHALSTVVLILCLIEFLLLSDFATSVFFLITLMALFDVLSGFMVSIVSARRDFGVGDQLGE